MSTTIEAPTEPQVILVINELYRVFDLLNAKFFENKLNQPIISIHSKKRAYGTFWSQSWINKNEKKPAYNEITINPEYFNRPTPDIVATLIHEMVHLYCFVADIKDTSNNSVYHNKKFKAEAEARGLIIEHAKTIGWSVTKLQEPTKELIKSFKINENVFDYYRKSYIPFKTPSVKKPRMKYRCECGHTISSSKELKIQCNVCNACFEVVA